MKQMLFFFFHFTLFSSVHFHPSSLMYLSCNFAPLLSGLPLIENDNELASTET